MKDLADITAYILGGNATGTLSNSLTSKHFTYRFIKAKTNGRVTPEGPWFVSLLTGPDNTEDYTYLGTIFPELRLRMTKKSTMGFEAPAVKALHWLLRFPGDELPPSVDFQHMGRCSACNLPLTNPESLRVGMGPVCRSRA